MGKVDLKKSKKEKSDSSSESKSSEEQTTKTTLAKKKTPSKTIPKQAKVQNKKSKKQESDSNDNSVEEEVKTKKEVQNPTKKVETKKEGSDSDHMDTKNGDTKKSPVNNKRKRQDSSEGEDSSSDKEQAQKKSKSNQGQVVKKRAEKEKVEKEEENGKEEERQELSQEKLEVFIGNLPFNADEDTIREFFKDCGEMLAVRVPPGKGFAFIEFADKEGQQKAVSMNGCDFDGRALRINNANSKKDNTQAGNEYTVLINNLRFEVSEESLRERFSECGEIESLRVPKFEDSGRCRGFAFVTFKTTEARDKALTFNETEFEGRTIGVSIPENKGRGGHSGRRGGFGSPRGGGRGRGAFGSPRGGGRGGRRGGSNPPFQGTRKKF
jgi:nucleolin